jgi:hypothetical protein
LPPWQGAEQVAGSASMPLLTNNPTKSASWERREANSTASDRTAGAVAKTVGFTAMSLRAKSIREIGSDAMAIAPVPISAIADKRNVRGAALI